MSIEIVLLSFGFFMLAVILILQVLSFFKPSNQSELISAQTSEKVGARINENAKDLIERFNQLENALLRHLQENKEGVHKTVMELKDKLTEAVRNDFNSIRQLLDEKLRDMNNKVSENITTNFKQSTETFQKVLERIIVIDETQKKIENLSKEVIDLNHVLTDKKSRGTFGEVQLKQLLVAVFGEKNDKVFLTQHKLSNNTQVDAVIIFPEPTGKLCVDSKFPLENYRKMLDAKGEVEKEQLARLFKQDVKRHIDDISSKYIIEGETSENAVMFIPAEAVFAEIYARHSEVVDYGYKKKVYLVSPTTFMAVCNTLQIALKDAEIRKHSKEIEFHLKNLAVEFSRYQDRWKSLSNSLDRVQKDSQEISITSKKISDKFAIISRGRVALPPVESPTERETLFD